MCLCVRVRVHAHTKVPSAASAIGNQAPFRALPQSGRRSERSYARPVPTAVAAGSQRQVPAGSRRFTGRSQLALVCACVIRKAMRDR
eukprot:360900-Chlamydomonas_euryale.AAC.1